MKPNWNFHGREFKHRKNLVGGAIGVLTRHDVHVFSLQKLKRKGYLFYFLPIKWILQMLSLLLRYKRSPVMPSPVQYFVTHVI